MLNKVFTYVIPRGIGGVACGSEQLFSPADQRFRLSLPDNI